MGLVEAGFIFYLPDVTGVIHSLPPLTHAPKIIAVVSDITLDAVGITEMNKTQSPPTRGNPLRVGDPHRAECPATSRSFGPAESRFHSSLTSLIQGHAHFRSGQAVSPRVGS